MKRAAIGVFARAVVPGRTKTRLAAAVGDAAAARLAAAFCADTCAALAGLADVEVILAVDGGSEGLPGLEAWDQGAGDLGARVERILARLLDRGRVAIAIGADSPGMPIDRVEHLIDRAPGLIPADDGGFVALAIERCPPGLLADLPWSAVHTGAATRARVEARLGACAVLEPWWDVDRPDDLLRLSAWLEAHPELAPRTRAVLAGLPLR